MQRPTMMPQFHEPAPKPRKNYRRALFGALAKGAKAVGRVLFWRPIAFRRGDKLRVEDGHAAARFMKAVAYRLVFVPIFLALWSAALVFSGTHANMASAMAEPDPSALGIYYDPVSFLTEDHVALDGWLIPVIDAKRILAEGNQALKERHAAVVLVHGHGATRQQILPLVKPLHEAGFVVVAIGLRGDGAAAATHGETFGLNEALDVKSAVEMLRRQPGVDPNKIALVGVGTGANAVMIAADRDPLVAATVSIGPLGSGNEAIATFIGPRQPYLKWMNQLCEWAFDVGYSLDADELDLSRRTGPPRPTLSLPAQADIVSPRVITQITAFLGEHVVGNEKK